MLYDNDILNINQSSVQRLASNQLMVAINEMYEGIMEGAEDMPDDIWEKYCLEYKKIRRLIKTTDEKILSQWVGEWSGVIHDGIGQVTLEIINDLWKLLLNKL